MRISCVALLGLSCVPSEAFVPRQSAKAFRGLQMSAPPKLSTNSVKDTTSEKEAEEFQNNGIFRWMQPFLDNMGAEEGKVIKYGFLPSDPDPREKSDSYLSQASRKNEAIENMTNIDMDERQRRDQAGDIMIKLTIAYAIGSSLFLDDGSLQAQKGLWDFGDGLTKIDDPDLAQRFLEKVNSMNLSTFAQASAIAAVFAALPQSMTQPAAFISIVFAVLYLVRDSIPSSVE